MNLDRIVRVTKCTFPTFPTGSADLETREDLGEMRYGAFVDLVRGGSGQELLTSLWQMPDGADGTFVQYALTWRAS